MKNLSLFLALLFPTLIQTQQGQIGPVGIESLVQLERLPLLRRGVWFHSVSSQDVTGGNNDGFAAKFSNQYVEKGRYVLLDARGPMCVQLLRTARFDRFADKLGFDGDLTIETRENGKRSTETLPFGDIFSGLRRPFFEPLVRDERQAHGSSWSFVPICSDDGIKIFSDQGASLLFFDIYYHSFLAGTAVKSYESQMSLAPAIERWKNIGKPFDARPANSTICRISLPPLTAVPIWSSSVPGTVTGIHLNLQQMSHEALRRVRIRAYWDGELHSSIDSPLGPFWGMGYWPTAKSPGTQGKLGFVPPKGPKGYPTWVQEPVELGGTETQSLPVGAARDGLYNYFPMPFFKSARIEFVNESETPIPGVSVTVDVVPGLPPLSSAYFHAQWREENPTLPQHDYTVLETRGQGHYVGAVLVMSTIHYDPARRNDVQRMFLEGDARFYIDDNRTFANASTGTEEYFLWGWYDVGATDKVFSYAVNGYPWHDIDSQDHTVMYRFHLSDLVPYYKSFRFALEHGPEGNIPSHYSSTAFYYQVDTPSLELTDQLAISDLESEKSHGYSASPVTWQGCRDLPFEGDRQIVFHQAYQTDKKNGTNTSLDDAIHLCGQRVTGAIEFSTFILGDNQGVELRRVLDYAPADLQGQDESMRPEPLISPGETARVYVDGASVGEWYTPPRHARLAWLEDAFQIPDRLTKGKERISVRLEVLPGMTWSAFQYRTYSYRDLKR